MSFFNQLAFLLPMTLFVMSCKPAPFVPGNSKTNYIRFGNGGGFTGGVTAYYLTEDGNIFQDQGDTIVKIGKSEASWTRQMFLIPGLLDVKNKPYNNPGNRYFFIEYSIDDQMQNITWGGEPLPIPAYETWYKNLMHQVKIKNLTQAKSVE